MKKLLFVFMLMSLAGCQPPPPPEPMMFGVPQSQWNQLSKKQQDLVIQDYTEKQNIDAQNAPVQNAITAANQIIQQQQFQQMMGH